MSAANLEHYLNDHLAGAAGALVMVEDLSKRENAGEDAEFFKQLHEEIYADRELLLGLMSQANLRSSALLQAAGSATAKLGRLKLMWEGFEPGQLGLFEALEMLVIGIQGKRLLWHALEEAASEMPEWSGADFPALAESAKNQRDRVEKKRLAAAREALSK
jgi:hypothetical protein